MARYNNDGMANSSGWPKTFANALRFQFKSNIPNFCVTRILKCYFGAEQFGLKTRLEVFGDRAYQDNYQIVQELRITRFSRRFEEVNEHLRYNRRPKNHKSLPI